MTSNLPVVRKRRSLHRRFLRLKWLHEKRQERLYHMKKEQVAESRLKQISRNIARINVNDILARTKLNTNQTANAFLSLGVESGYSQVLNPSTALPSIEIQAIEEALDFSRQGRQSLREEMAGHGLYIGAARLQFTRETSGRDCFYKCALVVSTKPLLPVTCYTPVRQDRPSSAIILRSHQIKKSPLRRLVDNLIAPATRPSAQRQVPQGLAYR